MTTQRRIETRPLTIAHRGACAYLPEHSLAAKAMAHAMGADYLEQDVVATRDDQLVVLHDIHVDRVTNVAAVFPARQRADGRYYARDFSLAELQSLELTERTDAAGRAVFPSRFPVGDSGLSIPTLDQEIRLVQGMNASMGTKTGIYPEIKKPAWHHKEGVDVAQLLLEALSQSGYEQRPDQVFVQCFDVNENIRLRNELKCQYRQIQLIADDAWQDAPTPFATLLTPGGLTQLKGVVAGIGPWIPQLYSIADDGTVMVSRLIEESNLLGLEEHTYTLSADALTAGFGFQRFPGSRDCRV